MLEKVDLSKELPKEEYKSVISGLKNRLGELQRKVYNLGIPVIIVFEGWDAAGKGTMINRLLISMDPRGFTVHPTNPPNEEERLRPFLQQDQAQVVRLLPGDLCCGSTDCDSKQMESRPPARAAHLAFLVHIQSSSAGSQLGFLR